MPSASKNAAASGRRKSDKVDKASEKFITLKVNPAKLRAIISPGTVAPAVKEGSPIFKDSPSATSALPAPASAADNASDSTPNTPANGGTPAPQPATMGPPAEGPKKKGVKRTAATGPNGEPKVRGKPGPKKKARLEDGSIDPTPRATLGHKLGPKANQGAINAGLRALDRSGKPCRKWAKGTFTLKSFTGVVWEIPRWTAPPRPKPVESTPENSAAASADSSVKKKDGQANGAPENKDTKQAPKDKPEVNGAKAESNKENEQVAKSDNSNSGGDVEMQDASSATPSAMASSPAPTPTPAPAPVATAS